MASSSNSNQINVPQARAALNNMKYEIARELGVNLKQGYNGLDGVYNSIEKITGKLKEYLINGKESAYLSHYLARIVTDEKLDYKLSDFEYSFPFCEDVREMFKRYQFEIMLKKTDLFEKSEVEKIDVNYNIVDNQEKLQEMIDKINKANEMSIYIDNDNFNVYAGNEFKINFGKDLFSMGLNLDSALSQLKPILENKEIKKVVYDYKSIKHILYKNNINLNGVNFDCVIARYLINSLAKSNINFSLMLSECGLDSDISAYALVKVRDIYLEKLKSLGLIDLYYDIELPLVDVLFDMEIEGFAIDKEQLKELELKYREEIVTLEKNIYEIIGKKFNLSSPKQLSEILFDELDINIPSNKKKSTSIEILQEIEHRHPVVPLIIRWRAISKLYSTYIIGFENIIGNDGRVHTIFNQTLTATGRLSSSEPNLQNIPVRTEEGKNLRKIFIPKHKDGFICSADYSQIELRLLANFSGDKNMIYAFKSGQDIHKKTASEIFGIPLNMVDDIKRREAKAINFGIVYGISDFGLSQNIGIARKDASNYIKLYFSRYPDIEKYINDNVEYARKNLEVRTMFGRLRPVPEINSSRVMLRNFGERVAMNMPLQGSASDIIKLAMIKIFNELNRKGLKSKIIVQVHDELVLDVYPGELEEVRSILKAGMENVVDLEVPLEVNIEFGRTWFDAK